MATPLYDRPTGHAASSRPLPTRSAAALSLAVEAAAPQHDAALPQIGVVLLTQGTRPTDLARALASVTAQRGVRTDVVVVGNGWRPTGLPVGVQALHLPENLGIPAGRNAGVALVEGEYVLFLDDDAQLASPWFLRAMVAKFEREPKLGLVQPRVDPVEGVAPTRWIPRLRKGDPRRSSPVFSCWEGAVVVRREAFLAAGSWPDEFFYAHEGIDMAFRIWDTGHRVLYAGDIAALHPVIDPARHVEYQFNNARNRVWIARRNLPFPISWLYVATWTLVQVARAVSTRDLGSLTPWFRGWRAGWHSDPGPSRRMRWSTVGRMTLLGRPPIV